MTALHLATAEDADRLLPMIAACHAELGIDRTDAERASALGPLLDGSPHGVAYIIGPTRAPIGYTVISFGWSLEHGGLAGSLDEIWIRPGVRGRGIGSEVLSDLPKALADAGLRALNVKAPSDAPRLDGFYRRARFMPVQGQVLMTRRF